MRTQRCFWSVVCLLAPVLPACANAPRTLDARELAAQIDQHISAKWQQARVTPAPLADDAELLRRLYLDLTGRIPRVSEARDFLGDKRPDRREQLFEHLLGSPQYVSHFTTTWSEVILPPAPNAQFQFQAGTFRAWLKAKIQANTPFNVLTRELLASEYGFQQFGRGQLVQPGMQVQPNAGTQAFFQANELKPENVAATTARVFLGVRLECAQCHDHPFADWKRQQFWEFAAFFAGVQPPQFQRNAQGVVQQPQPLKRSLKIPGTEKTVEARFLDNTAPKWDDNAVAPRQALVAWMTADSNPYFARTVANRVWEHFFGYGLGDPVDDEPTADNPVSHPALLKELTEQFIAHNYDVQYLLRAIALSQTYQRTSTQTDKSQQEPRLFARMALKGLTAEQLFESLCVATGYREPENPNARFGGFNPASIRADFLTRFASQERRIEAQTSILQALALMNGKFIGDATSLQQSKTLGAVLDAPFLTTAQKLETLYLATLSRQPRPEEVERLSAYLERGGARGNPQAALADVFWALLNSPEFMLNH